jgi:hypothetical protein
MTQTIEIPQEINLLIRIAESALPGLKQGEEVINQTLAQIRAVEKLYRDEETRHRLLVRQLLDQLQAAQARALEAERGKEVALAKRDEALRKEAVVKEHFDILNEERSDLETENINLNKENKHWLAPIRRRCCLLWETE